MENQKNLLPTLCHLCGMKPTRNLRNFRYEAVMTTLLNKYTLKKQGGGTGFSPLHIAAEMAGDKQADLYLDGENRVNLVDGMYLTINFIVGTTNVLILPNTKGAKHIARLWAYIVSCCLKKSDSPLQFNRYAYVLVDPRNIDKEHTRIDTISFDDVDNDVIESTYSAFVTAALTDDETDFDIEIELQGVRSRSNAARERIKRRMQKLGVRVLKGKKASIYLRSTPKKCTVDLKRLSIEFPEAYSACVTEEAKKYEYLTFKLNHENG